MHRRRGMLVRVVLTLMLSVGALQACERRRGTDDGPKSVTLTSAEEKPGLGEGLVNEVAAHGVHDARVLRAIAKVPRHELVPASERVHAYEDRPLPIGEGQTISQPSIVALMTQLAEIEPEDRVLEIGTGSGYQAAVLAELAREVYTIEIVEPLSKRAQADLERLGYGTKIHFRIGDGYAGWPEAAPFDAIIVTAAPPHVPQPLKEQLKVGGRLVIPVGRDDQELRVIERTTHGWVQQESVPVRFVPMTGRAQEAR
jgi:protein-L-isoaspartate(D-aspartate) O-methyltransferase